MTTPSNDALARAFREYVAGVGNGPTILHPEVVFNRARELDREGGGDEPVELGELTPERIEHLAGAVAAAWCKSSMKVRSDRCRLAAAALRELNKRSHSPAVGVGREDCLDREMAAYDAGWHQCAKWADRNDLHADTDSPAYERDRATDLARLKPSAMRDGGDAGVGDG